MNAAELDIRRRALGLSIAETAEVLGVGQRTLSYWFAGEGEPRNPEELAARLLEVETVMGDLVEDIADIADDDPGIASVTLRRFRSIEALVASGLGRGLPLGAYLMALSWAIDDLRATDHHVSVEWAG